MSQVFWECIIAHRYLVGPGCFKLQLLCSLAHVLTNLTRLVISRNLKLGGYRQKFFLKGGVNMREKQIYIKKH